MASAPPSPPPPRRRLRAPRRLPALPVVVSLLLPPLLGHVEGGRDLRMPHLGGTRVLRKCDVRCRGMCTPEARRAPSGARQHRLTRFRGGSFILEPQVRAQGID